MRIQLIVAVFLFTLILFSTVTLAQITIASADAFAINAFGNEIINHLDSTSTSIVAGSPGSTSGDFSALNSNFTNTSNSLTLSSSPYYLSAFPNSKVVFNYKVMIDASHLETGGCRSITSSAVFLGNFGFE